MEFKNLTSEMLEFRLGHDADIDPDWFVAHLTDIISYDPHGCFAVCDGDKVVGMITSTVYQEVAWLGWLFVLEDYRNRGLGAALMNAGINHVRARGAKSIIIEADLKAVSLYHRLGFIEQFKTQHFLLTRGNFKAGHRTMAEIKPVTESDLELLAKFDRGYFHQDRLSLFRTVIANPNFRGWVARVKGQIAGYMFTTEAAENQQVSPLVADVSGKEAEEIVGGLIREAFKACFKPLYFRCPMRTKRSADVLRELGAQEVDYHTLRMYLGEGYRFEGEGILSLGCPGKG